MEMRLGPFVKGAASFALPSLRRTAHRVTNISTESAEFCYSIFLRHYSHAAAAGRFRAPMPEHVAELGPGSSLGVGLCALICGAQVYYALDLVDYTDPARNLAIFDQLVKFFRERRPVIRDDVTFPEPLAWEFPDALVVSSDRRLEELRKDLHTQGGRFIRMAVPWTDATVVPSRSIGWLWSHSVLEHVDDIEHAWQSCARWIASDGVMTHNIDYRSHGLTKHWDGHWGVSDHWWKVLRGRRPYLINRLPHSVQMKIAKESGLAIVNEAFCKWGDNPSRKLTPRFASLMTTKDQGTTMAFVTLVDGSH